MSPHDFEAFHLPHAGGAGVRRRAIGPHHGRFANVTPVGLAAEIAAALRAAQSLSERSIASILASLDTALTDWRDPNHASFADALRILPDLTGYSQEVVRHGLGALIEPLSGHAIGRLLDEELGDRRVLDEGVAGRRARGVAWITHVLAGNIPGLGFAPIALSLALRSAVVVKSAAGDPYSAAAFARSIAHADPALGRCIIVADWRGGDTALEDVAFAAPIVVASGDDATIADIARRASGRVQGHGHKVSFAFVGQPVLTDPQAARDAADRLATDIAVWDQHGCLSPQMCVLESDDPAAAGAFAEMLANALRAVTTALPPRQRSLDDRAAIAAFRADIEWSPEAAGKHLIVPPDSADWTISVEPGAAFGPSCLNRCIRLIPLASADALPHWLADQRGRLECVGLACDAPHRAAIGALLARCGVHRICDLGAMQAPDLRWRQSGRPRVADWVEWSIDEGYEAPHGEPT